ncbi:uncharacterized protein LOC126234379 [Schistocerca nitens]|uniref:uncharacterized protein LOC126234379 n=1 Tax=Schistocerca nitens TaxID=7011 RepID=UPI00211966F4|nr:uncharacterized protein LOC126234379 [Schistocerca nitens]
MRSTRLFGGCLSFGGADCRLLCSYLCIVSCVVPACNTLKFAMTSWSKQNTLHFREAVRRHPCIWDVKLGDKWEEIAKAFNVSRKECEDKWHNLKSQYSRELAKRESSKGTGSATSNVYHTSWYAFESMQFIRDNYKPLSHRSNNEVVPVMEAPATEGNGEGEGSISFPFDVTEMEEVANPRPHKTLWKWKPLQSSLCLHMKVDVQPCHPVPLQV